MKNIAYILLAVAGLMLLAVLVWAFTSLVDFGLNEKTIMMLLFGGIAGVGLISRVIYVAKDSFGKEKKAKNSRK
ncbi:hypothetical protein VB776_09390 [Arcicella sp. DC2W]|uniref:Signal peptidase n=1 Tax=Arcicella gelida TaxID=2984195 RepID=A0ABU5S3W8_9BACT|nr:hypothetical protein [Arcicella sp. DC2W]MEA5403127.1 hypothetical protein [Arcicella sp. DC2W]